MHASQGIGPVTDRAQDTEAIRAVLGWAAEPGGNAQAALARLVARLEAAEQALREIADSKAYGVGKDGHGRAGMTPYEWARASARAALAAAAPGETERTP